MEWTDFHEFFRLIEDDTLLQEIIERAFNWAHEFDTRSMVDRFEEVYAELDIAH